MQWDTWSGLLGWLLLVIKILVDWYNSRDKQKLDQDSASFDRMGKLNEAQKSMIETLQKNIEQQQVALDKVAGKVSTLEEQQHTNIRRIAHLEGAHDECRAALDYAKKQAEELMRFLKEIKNGHDTSFDSGPIS